MTVRLLPVMTVLAAISLVILVQLGQWQYDKFVLKSAATPDDLPPIIRVEGTVLPAIEGRALQHVYGIADGEPVWRSYAPVRVAQTGDILLALLGVTGGPRPIQADAPAGELYSGDVRVFPRPGREAGRNRPEQNLWYVFDRAGILGNYGVDDGAISVAEPAQITIRNADDVSRTRETNNPYGAPQPIDDLPPARHLGYALTWWGLAAALVVMYLVYHVSQGRISLKSR
ncbi:MAG: SURF1 family cytochrome oxidase biogenesis protein [Pseudomonadota bacterium]